MSSGPFSKLEPFQPPSRGASLPADSAEGLHEAFMWSFECVTLRVGHPKNSMSAFPTACPQVALKAGLMKMAAAVRLAAQHAYHGGLLATIFRRRVLTQARHGVGDPSEVAQNCTFGAPSPGVVLIFLREGRRDTPWSFLLDPICCRWFSI